MKIFYGIISLASIVIAILAFQANPDFLLYRGNYSKIISKAYQSEHAQFKTLNSSCENVAQYRYDERRQGIAPDEYQPKVKAQIVKHIFPLNVDIHGASKSSPTIDDTGVYIGSDTGWFWKMNHDGEVLWRFYVPGSLNGIHGSAAVDDKKVYIGTYNGFMYALDKENGDLVWANPVAQYVGASPLIAGGALYIAGETSHPDGIVTKLDCNTGKTIWVSEWLGGHSHSSPSFDKVTNSILVGANSGRFFVLDAETGATRWDKQLGGQIKGTPMVWDGTVYFGSWDKHYHAYYIKSGEERWSQFMGGRIQTSLSLIPEKEIGITNTKVGEIIGISLKDGEILWRLKHGDGNHQFSALITKDPKRENEYLAWSRCKEYQICVLDGVTGKLQNNIDLPGSFTSVPYAYKDKIYISLDKDQGMVILQ